MHIYMSTHINTCICITCHLNLMLCYIFRYILYASIYRTKIYVVAFLKIIFFASALQSFLFHGRRPIMLFVPLCVHVGFYWADKVCLGTWCTLGVLKSWKDLQPEHGGKHSGNVENTMWGRISILNTIISQLNIIIKELVRLKIRL